MDTTTVAQPAPPSTPEPQPAYVLRGLGLFELFREQVLDSYQGGGRWLVPSGSESGGLYEVRVGVRRPSSCECRGFASHKHCSHVAAAQHAAKKSAVCDCCGDRCWWSNLTQVTEDHESLTFFVGDVVCRRCARGTDIL